MDELVGEGRVAKVFSLTSSEYPCNVATKIWRHKPLFERVVDLKNSRDVWYEYKKLQFLDPHDEYKLQCEIWRAGFRDMPCPIAYVEAETNEGPRKVLAMEEIKGHTLHDILARGCVIENPTWRDLAKIVADLHRVGVLHRDIKPDNIMLETDQPLDDNTPFGTKFSGKLKLIDFGRSKRHYGTGSPDPEDFTERIASDLPPINYSVDSEKLEQLKVKGRPFAHIQ